MKSRHVFSVVTLFGLCLLESQALAIEAEKAVYAVAFSPDGKQVLAGGGEKVAKLWDAQTGKLSRTFKGHSSNVEAVAFSPDGTHVLTGGGKSVKLWEAATSKLIRSFTVSSDAKSIAFSPDGDFIAAADFLGQMAMMWDTRTGELIRNFKGHSAEVVAVAFSPDGRRLLTGGYDYTARLWDTATGKMLQTIVPRFIVNSVAFCRRGNHGLLLLTASGRFKSLSEDPLLYEALKMTAEMEDAAAPPLSTDVAELWETNGNRIKHFGDGYHKDQVSSVACSPDGKRVLTGSFDKSAALWDVKTGKKKIGYFGHRKIITSVVFSPDSSRVLTGSADGTVKLWESDTGKLNRTFNY